MLLATFICGCSSVKWAKIKYMSPANEINLKKSPSIKLVAAGNQPGTAMLCKQIAAKLEKSGQFKRDDKNPDYWIVLNGAKMYRADNRQSALFNRNVKKVREENQRGGQEWIKKTDYLSSAAAASINVAIYSVKDLAPVYYFDIVLYDSDFIRGKARSQQEYYKKFAAQIIRKFNDGFLVQGRRIETAIPKNANPALRKALLSGKASRVIEQGKTYLPEPFEKYIADVLAGKNKDQGDLEEKLSNYYILALAQEMGSFDIALLKKLHAQHVTTLNLTESSGLKIACPNSIARIESKLKLLQALK